jgi:hypothetical protein
MEVLAMVRLNWPILGALAFTCVAWALIADGGYRLTHDGRPGLRHAVYARAKLIVHEAKRLV